MSLIVTFYLSIQVTDLLYHKYAICMLATNYNYLARSLKTASLKDRLASNNLPGSPQLYRAGVASSFSQICTRTRNHIMMEKKQNCVFCQEDFLCLSAQSRLSHKTMFANIQ
jgi:hypothetical protein